MGILLWNAPLQIKLEARSMRLRGTDAKWKPSHSAGPRFRGFAAALKGQGDLAQPHAFHPLACLLGELRSVEMRALVDAGATAIPCR